MLRRQTLMMTLPLLAMQLGGCGEEQDAGTIVGQQPAQSMVAIKSEGGAAAAAALGRGDAQILFGDLHTHTSFSPDGFILGMPLTGGEGVRPPADACDYARYCSAVDFWGISDHAEGITPHLWQQTRDSIRACNAVAGNGGSPDMVSFLGFEWSHVAATSAAHYGHKNVFFRDTADAMVPSRPIAAPRDQLSKSPIGRGAQVALAVRDWPNRDFYLNIQAYYDAIADTPRCASGVNSRELPTDCHEVADNPRELFSKLDDWGFEALVIPHGNTWGLSTPEGTSWDKQLSNDYHDPRYQNLIEVYSGHGNSEEYRDFVPVEYAADGSAQCPLPSPGFLPCCWRAGEIIQQRCEEPASAACAASITAARQAYVDAGISGHLTVPGAQVSDWLNCGQCEDCFNPSFKLRPKVSTQYALTLDKPENEPDRQRFQFGFIGSSDNHRARAGNGYKDIGRKRGNTEAMGVADAKLQRSGLDRGDPASTQVRRLEDLGEIGLNELRNMERQQSFWLTGGLVAVHAEGRDRDSIWSALRQREVYATSGDRILLWFDLLNSNEGELSMGSATDMTQSPRFRVSAAGAFRQLPGCPPQVAAVLGSDRQASLCANECYNPGDERKAITRIEVVKITPRRESGERTEDLIEDTWRSFECAATDGTCSLEFSDPEFALAGRDATYYVRAIQEPSPAVNAGGLRCDYDENGVCIAVNPCFGDYRTPADDDCQSPNEERAWSSPIYINYRN
ncbi:DUF3604 domain-containing protein [Halieaceae bacterium IMCC14734]|uniref:DUF3604 domain-containing protein n=1 Tax=Candidatus Litorirhabdus singularis TaxID=2518993 RepID=A0ABT3TGY0_9GAMM|nr:DUF3604 domain-containing protein [Candidatus Litorirhabdus singularis]MCX2981531.1 DUF3604 domain-containing protein [Candidatus Litorirhabdus singularis]